MQRFGHQARGRHLALAIPIIVLVLAFTAVPVELRAPRMTLPGLFNGRLEVYDIAVNIVGYVPIGVVCAARSWGAAAGFALVTSGLAESTQLFARGRETSLVDLATNVFGALVGWAMGRHRGVQTSRIRIDRRRGVAAFVLALTCFLIMWRVTPRDVEESITAVARTLTVLGRSSNDRGVTAPGGLEARWTFDTNTQSEQGGVGETVTDASGNGLNGVLVNGPALVPGISGDALQLDGSNQHVDFRDPVSLRMTGSMTVSAWINSSRFPRSDAVVVSNYAGLGYQLDTTVDEGPRTIAFRFTNAWGGLTSRYGVTPLETNRWYHVAGVFDADARTLNVFLDGELDNGCLAGTVTGRQTISPDHLYIGRPALTPRFAFAGSIDDVRIYSRALSRIEIQEEMRAASRSPRVVPAHRLDSGASEIACRPTEPPDSRTAGLIVTLGVLAAVGVIGLWPFRNYRGVALAVSVVAGILVAPTVTAKVSAYQWWLIPLLTLAGAVAVVASTRTVTPDQAPPAP